jgi:hypothetical protein
MITLIAAGISFAAAEGDPRGEADEAAKKELPEGMGIAAKFPGDTGIAKHASVIFADNFEKGELAAKWDEARNKGNVLSLEKVPGGPVGEKSLRVEAHLGKDTGGGMTKWFDPTPKLFVRFYTRFDAKCDYVHHFVTLRANKGLQGSDRWSGFGGAGLKPKGDDRFSTALEPWGDWGRNEAPGKWNFYSYWHEMSAAPDKKYWGNGFRPAKQANIEKDKWICCEFMLKENTPGKPDGEQAFWIDGELRGHWKGINWRRSPILHANALTMEAYVTDRWTKNPVNVVFFDNVVISKEYVGPSGK